MIVEAAERMDAHDRGDREQQHRALAAVTFRLAAAVEPDADREEGERGRKLDHAHRAHRLSSPVPIARVRAVAASVMTVRARSSAIRPMTTAPAPLATPRKVSARFISGGGPDRKVAVNDHRAQEQQHRGRAHHQEAAEAPHLLDRRALWRLGHAEEAQADSERGDADQAEQNGEDEGAYWHARHSS